ncbi:hypothetical protein [Frigoribacterium sp. PhB116]|uniref:hypothetical protein n=1 Tax=Frigoribacterium sp. PhB116 TaxID=2485174 RepID=UPI00106148C7|nr:hypothetical protein [Frigoribacterium sp. PhB116]TDT64106.1 hypothetical protein EDF20_1594 [Frigoribacterium sp. PhB116]
MHDETRPTATPTCPDCHGPARLVDNPYYGSGLSVHPWVLTCTACSSSTFVPREEPRAAAAPCPIRGRSAWARLVGRRGRR